MVTSSVLKLCVQVYGYKKKEMERQRAADLQQEITVDDEGEEKVSTAFLAHSNADDVHLYHDFKMVSA